MPTIAEMMDLSGKTAIVTGGAKGIGFGISARLAEAGADLLVADRDADAAEAAAHQLTDRGHRAHAFPVDVSDEEDVVRLMTGCEERFGSLDVLVNNAGIFPMVPIERMTAADFDEVLGVNLRGAFLTTRHAADVMKRHGGGKIINITSIEVLHPSMVGMSHYAMSKHGILGLTKNSAMELAPHKIWVNAIAPGGVTTPGTNAMIEGALADHAAEATEAFLAKLPMRRMGDPDDIGRVALFLASDLASYMTGEQIVVDGGALLC
jgi:2-deoxy-D-gluconate 3-dehydrogenase